jgi:hypothetical protein
MCIFVKSNVISGRNDSCRMLWSQTLAARLSCLNTSRLRNNCVYWVTNIQLFGYHETQHYTCFGAENENRVIWCSHCGPDQVNYNNWGSPRLVPEPQRGITLLSGDSHSTGHSRKHRDIPVARVIRERSGGSAEVCHKKFIRTKTCV